MTIQPIKMVRLKIGLLIGLSSLLLVACTVQGVPAPAVDIDATVEAAVKATVDAERAANAVAAEEGAAATDTPEPAVADNTGAQPMLITPTPDQSAAIAELLLANTRHFIGDPNAPVTIIEFSDFL